MRRFVSGVVSGVGDAVGSVVYVAAYGPIFVGWHLVGRHVAKAARHVLDSSHGHEVDMLIESHGDLGTLKELMLRAYYNALLRETQQRQVGAA